MMTWEDDSQEVVDLTFGDVVKAAPNSLLLGAIAFSLLVMGLTF